MTYENITLYTLIYEIENHRACKASTRHKKCRKRCNDCGGNGNRSALPAIFNPEDLNALEQALRLKEQNPGSTVGLLTMGPPRAAEIIRQGLYRGADKIGRAHV